MTTTNRISVRTAVIALVAFAALVGGTIAVVFAVADDHPDPITRAELMSRYADIAPIDESATPETVDELADSTCAAIDEGHTTDALIEVATDTYRAQATEVIQLLVSYRCPQHLDLFQ